MSFRGITFNAQTVKSEDHAMMFNTIINGAMGRLRGCAVSYTESGTITVDTGYFIAYGRLINVNGAETFTLDSVSTNTYGYLVFTIDLSLENTTSQFNQGYFEVLTDTSSYPTLTQEDLFGDGTKYQLPFAKFIQTSNGITSFVYALEDVNVSEAWTDLNSKVTEFQAELDAWLDDVQAEWESYISELKTLDRIESDVIEVTVTEDNTPLNTVLACAWFPIEVGDGYVTFGNYDEWIAAGCPVIE